MTGERIEREFHEQVIEKIRLAAEGPNRFRVFTPFVFDDGDHLAVVLRKEDAKWALSDEGHTYMHLARGHRRAGPRTTRHGEGSSRTRWRCPGSRTATGS